MMHKHKTFKLSVSPAELALITITMVWGVTFLIVQIAMSYGAPALFVGVRFICAGLMVGILFWRSMLGLTRREILAGTSIGLAIFLGYGLQSFGLQTISSSKSAFITALYVPIVPLLQWILLRKPPRLLSWAGICLAVIGLSLLAGPEALEIGLGIGEIATLIGAIAIAIEIILISQFAHDVDSRRITVIQLLAAGIFASIFSFISNETPPHVDDGIWIICALSLALASAIIQFTMNWAQKSVSATKATLIYATEPVWAGIVGRLAGDRLPFLSIIGGVFIVAGVIVSEIKISRKAKNEKPSGR
ncbi:DMT family transporter [Brucellaceae bacterium C25G]